MEKYLRDLLCCKLRILVGVVILANLAGIAISTETNKSYQINSEFKRKLSKAFFLNQNNENIKYNNFVDIINSDNEINKIEAEFKILANEVTDDFNDTTTTTTATTTTTTTTTITTTSDTTIISNLLEGNSDTSIKYLFNLNSYGSVTIYSKSQLNILGSNYGSFNIHPNGLVSFGNIFSLANPTFSISNFNFPIIAPLWTTSALDLQSDIKLGRYDLTNMDQNLLAKLKSIFRNTATLSAYQPDLIYVITWIDVKYSATSDSSARATFQLILTISYTQQISWAMFNYAKVDWPSNPNQNIFIGYTDGKNRKITNAFSYNSEAYGFSRSIVDQLGNTNMQAKYAYDMAYTNLDRCDSWYNQKISSVSTLSVYNMPFIECPYFSFFMWFNPFYRIYRGSKWQNSLCYELRTNSFSSIFSSQLCCYNFGGILNIIGPNAGFVYSNENLADIFENGFKCCPSNWAKCSKFYNLYPATFVNPFIRPILIAWALGDPHLTTYDNLTYTFNGNGKFIFSKAKDNSFEIQASTVVLQNSDSTSSLSGTIFEKFAMKTSRSSLFEIKLLDLDSVNPYFELYVNKSNSDYADFVYNFAYSNDFYCIDKPSEICTTIIQDEDRVQFLFNNGLNIYLNITKVKLSETRGISWISVSVNFLNNDVFDYSNNLVGLMGNNNKDPNDDIRSRDDQPPASNSERDIFIIANTWKVTSDEDLFSPVSSNRMLTRYNILKNVNDYTPTFYEDLAIPDNIQQSCNNVKECIYDSLASGVPDIGKKTASNIEWNLNAAEEINKSPPKITFLNSSVPIDWYSTSQITIIATVTDTNSFKINLSMNKVRSNTTTILDNSSFNKTVVISFIPLKNEVPVIEITAVDDTGLTITSQLSGFLICNCKSLDESNICVYSQVLTAVNPIYSIVSCQCNQYYTGDYCDKIRDECSIGKPCYLPREFNSNLTCKSLTIQDQQKTGFPYKCEGTCPSGFKTQPNGECLDIDECQDKNMCPAEAKCTNYIGYFDCTCPNGYRFVSNKCELIDFCKTSSKNCDQICNSIVGNFTCDCYDGYNLNSTTNICELVAPIPECENFGCNQICFLNRTSNKAECACKKGYKLDQNLKICNEIDECKEELDACPDKSTCVNTNGSFVCNCENGSKFNPNIQKCELCTNNTYGQDCNLKCNCSANSVRCDRVTGCVCQIGYTGSDCETLKDPCSDQPIKKNSRCVNQGGVAEYLCLNGYEINSTTNECEPINACLNNPCPQKSTCINQEGNYTCSCDPGFKFNNITKLCDDIRECSNSSICPENSNCKELDGSYRCDCKNGYISDNSTNTEQNPKCIDFDECKIANLCPLNNICVNLVGTFNCTCADGYNQVSETNLTCVIKNTAAPIYNFKLIMILSTVFVLIFNLITA